MVTRIIIARHGNTFAKDQTPTRVGGRTDLPLVETERGSNVGKYIAFKGYNPSVAFAAPLKRTMETAKLAIAALGTNISLHEDHSFTEIDYGPDENKTEEEVIARIGEQAIELWNEKAIVPDGWKVDPLKMAQNWIHWGEKIEKEFKNKDVLIVSSNGIIRFAPYLTGDFDNFAREHDLKVATGAVCVFEKDEKDKAWRCVDWNIKPNKVLEIQK